MAAVLALIAAPGGCTVADLAANVHAITGHSDYTIRLAAYDLRKLRGKHLVVTPGHSRRYHTPPQAARTVAALLALRAQVIARSWPALRSPRRGRNPRAGPPSTATMNRSESACKPSSRTSASPPKPRHRQQIVDRDYVSA
jgi:hypothetical protein